MRRALPLLLAALALLTGCTGGPSSAPDDPATTLRVLAGSELADLAPVLERAAQATGIKVAFDFTGTLAGADQVASGAADAGHDAIWFSSNRYLALRPEAQARLATSAEVMSSPVVLGLRRSVAQRLRFVGRPVGWSEIAEAAGARRFTYGMTDPSASNTGFSAVVAVSTALVGSGAALDEKQAASTTPALTDFFAAQTLSAGSSGYLQDAFARRATGADPGEPVDGLINYESVLLGMNASRTLPEPLELIYPSDGVVTADYPFTALASASPSAKDLHRRLTAYLRTPEVQREIMTGGHWRPAVPGVALAPEFGAATLVELPFPTRPEVVDTLLTSWFDKVRRPSRTIYVLDVSGSMAEDDRIGALRRALTGLAGADDSLVGQYRRFRAREEVTLLPFSTVPAAPTTYTVGKDDPGPTLRQISDAATALVPEGGTAIYDGLESAYRVAGQQIAADPDRFTSIVLMTDGENSSGSDLAAFRAFAAARPEAVRGVPVFPVLFGESDTGEMEEVATLTGGRTFDARSGSLSSAFTEIRGHV
ncbi:MAG: Ca-activated chloride channel [Pseudonocardiales bacterium]|nr:Ca-activated chloride channel [Pseudonocardiales bacterium]